VPDGLKKGQDGRASWVDSLISTAATQSASGGYRASGIREVRLVILEAQLSSDRAHEVGQVCIRLKIKEEKTRGPQKGTGSIHNTVKLCAYPKGDRFEDAYAPCDEGAVLSRDDQVPCVRKCRVECWRRLAHDLCKRRGVTSKLRRPLQGAMDLAHGRKCGKISYGGHGCLDRLTFPIGPSLAGPRHAAYSQAKE
jgi:hypothetical protein